MADDFQVGEEGLVGDVLEVEVQFCGHYFFDVIIHRVWFSFQHFIFVAKLDGGIVGDAGFDGNDFELLFIV